MSKKIFISYAQEDQADADRVRSALPELGLAEGVAEILDPHRKLRAGDDIRKRIREEISAASTVVVVGTESSARSQWVNYEVGMAQALDKPIVIVGVGDRGRSKALSEYLSRFSDVRSIDFAASK